MMKKAICAGALGTLLAAGPPCHGAEYETLHEVIRHFQVAFVDRPNLGALLLGGLQGLKKAAPGVQVQLLPPPGMFVVRAGTKSVRIPRHTVHDYQALEQSLVRAADLAESQKMARGHQALEHAIIRELVAHCGDHWSVFLEADLYHRLLEDGSREMGDVGILVEPQESGLRVLDVLPASPAARAGIKVGAPFTSVAGRPANQLNELEALALMRGPVGTRVEVVVAGQSHRLVRSPPPKQYIRVDPPEHGIARIHLLDFRAGTGQRLAAVMKKLSGMQLEGLILDLRGNPGGLVDEGVAVTGLFIDSGTVVRIVSRDHIRTVEKNVTRPGPYHDLPLVVLLDGRSASVSEIVAMALRDHDRAKLVGTQSLGKGTVQVVLELMDGSALKLSNGRYYSPGGTPLYDGIQPDVEVAWDGTGDDPQLARARELLRGR